MIRIRCFGGISVNHSEHGPIHFRSRKHVALLTYLAANRERVFGRSELVRLFWDSPKASARHSLSQALYDIKRRLGEFSLERFADGLRLVTSIQYEGKEFEEAVETGALRTAVELYRGDFGSAYDRVGTETFEGWIDDERRRYRILAQAALHRYVVRCDGRGDWGQMCVAALKLVSIDPISEQAHRSLMRALWLHGDQASALHHFSEVEGQLSRDLPGGISAETYELVQRIRSSAPPAPAAIRRTEPPIVGREREFTQLRELVSRASRGEAVMAVLRGEAGIGKTRLSAELARCVAVEGVRLLACRCYAAEESIAYGPVVDALREFSDIVCGPDQTGGAAYAHLRRLLQCEPVQQPAIDLEADLAGERRRLYEEVVALLDGLCAAHTTIWIVDDVHWIDGSSASLLSYLMRRLASRPLLLLVTVRDGTELGDACRKLLRDRATDEQATTVSLGPLSPEAVIELAQRLEVPSAAGLADRIHQLSGGNPFLALELLRDAAAVTSPEAERLTADALLSERVRSLLQARLQGLAPSAIRLLESVSVLGRNATPTHAAHAAGLTLQEASGVSEELYARGVLRDAEARLEFAHDITREFVYRNLGGVRRASLHLFVAEALARDFKATLPTIARHFHLGGDRARAFEYAIRAATASIATFGHEEAKTMASLALSHAATDSERAAALGLLGRAEFANGSMLQAERHLSELVRLQSSVSPAEVANVRLLLARAQMERSDKDAASRTLDQLAASLHSVPDLVDQLNIGIEQHVLALKLAIRWHDPRRAQAEAEAIRERYEENQGVSSIASVSALYGLAAYAAFFQSADLAASLIEDAVDQARHECRGQLERTLLVAGLIEVRRAKWDRAESFLSDVLVEDMLRRQILEAGMARNNLAYCAVEQGRWDTARELCKESLRTYEGLPDNSFVKTAPLTNLGDLYFYQGRPRQAKTVYQEALKNVSDDYYWQLKASIALVALQLGDFDLLHSHCRSVREVDPASLSGVQERFKVDWLRAFLAARLDGPAAGARWASASADLREIDLPGALKLSWLCMLFFGRLADCQDPCTHGELRNAGMGWFARFSQRWHAAAVANSDRRVLEASLRSPS